ncbi:DoxX family membrane protein [Lascolabacillus massiliensis]|uniref:DoxX family membrane protein n=1 Tax=Lascolabacillus massiliensis TaxID=1627894 RepID=UPI0006B385D3|nr:DoxX family membrane protein [Lascolabacillus massiliensis]
MNNKIHYSYSNIQLTFLVILRVLIGWYFLYEGLAKVFTPNWTAFGYLIDSKGIFSPIFTAIAENPDILAISDFLNIWGLVIIGLLIILGLFERIGYIGAAALLVMYYLAHPPLMNVEYLFPTEGSYLWVDKNLILLFTVIVLYLLPTAKAIGFDRLIFNKK